MTFENRYSGTDRFLHRFAFRAMLAQRVLADIETAMYQSVLRSIALENPVFISGLPRSGTTILLNLLWATGHFASHTYQDVPFVLCPLLWNRFAGLFKVTQPTQERAHGDGIVISGSSPEAFEEVIWKHFWPNHYQNDRIMPWVARDSNEEFNRFLEIHMRKIIAVRRESRPQAHRYLSKNNVNIARLLTLPEALDAGVMLIPFREPVQHAASMLAQHHRFLTIHAKDDFVLRYMSGIGHHDFGLDLRPIDFGGWLSSAPDPKELEFWLRYWVAAYEFVLQRLPSSAVLVSYAHVVAEPSQALERLEDIVGVPKSDLISQAPSVRHPRFHDASVNLLPRALLERASNLYDQLTRVAYI